VNFKNETALLLDESAFSIVEKTRLTDHQIPGISSPAWLSDESQDTGL